jgi:hypothetical protein
MLIGSRLNKVFLTLMILVSLWLLGRSTTGLDGTEFSGGRLTGPMLDTCETGMLALIVAVALLYWFPRLSTSIALVGGLCCLPLPMYFFAP